MNGANMFVIYSSGSSVTLSPRTTSRHNQPTFDSSISAKLLDGSGITSSGQLVANVQCDSCLSWSGGSMSPTDSSSNWIMAYKNGDALDTSDTGATIQQHDSHTTFTLDLTKAVGGSSANPFVSSASSSSTDSGASQTASSTGGQTTAGSASSIASGSTSATSSVSSPVVSSVVGGNSGSDSSSTTSSTSGGDVDSLTLAHGVIMSILFLAAFPLFALTLYLPTANKVRFVHAPLQGLSVVLLIVGLALGIKLGQKIDELDTYHQIIGFIVVALLVLVQPALGIAQHLHFNRTGGRSSLGIAHQNLGRGTIALGVVNGGLGFHLAGTTGAYVPYAVIAAIVFVVYVGTVIYCTRRSKNSSGMPIDQEHKTPTGYEMQNSHRRLDSGTVQQTAVQPKVDRM